MFAYEKARMWKELFSLALDTDVTSEDLVDMGFRVAGVTHLPIMLHNADNLHLIESLVSHTRYSEAARVYLDYAQDVPRAISVLTRGNDLSEAFRVVRFPNSDNEWAPHIHAPQISMHKAHNLVEEIISPEALDLCTQLCDDIQEMVEQLTRQGQRLVELKEKKVSDPG
jgi:elongator complex protein 1